MISVGFITYDYDDRGNLSQITNGANITNYAYNAANRLTNVIAPGVSTSNACESDGRRVKQTVGSTITNYQWDEASPYGYVVNEYNSSGAMLASYVVGNDQLISQTRGSTISYYLQDGQGSTRALTNSTPGALTDMYSYNAFGDLDSSTEQQLIHIDLQVSNLTVPLISTTTRRCQHENPREIEICLRYHHPTDSEVDFSIVDPSHESNSSCSTKAADCNGSAEGSD